MPADRRKKNKTPDGVPEPGDPERKRVLNILAQRRYRERRREKIAALEAQVQSSTSPAIDQHLDGGVELDPGHGDKSSSAPVMDESVGIEEIIRSSEDLGFPMMEFNQEPLDLQLFGEFASPISLDDNTRSQNSSSTSISTLHFPLSDDGAQLVIPTLATIRAFSSIGTALNIMDCVWDPNYLHTVPPIPLPHLPPNLHPTPAQVAIPHHPLIDAIPWPSVRERLICILSLPSMCRPPVAQDDEPTGQGQSKAIMRLIQDLDDLEDGIKVHGNVVGWDNSSELVEEAWEMGGTFYRNWWFVVDTKAIETTNRRRKERGLGVLKIK